jgi:GxxExxY protein
MEAGLTENKLSKIVIWLAIDVHTALGPGLLESSYENCLFYELKECGLKVEK